MKLFTMVLGALLVSKINYYYPPSICFICVMFHIGWGGEQTTIYKDVETFL